MRPGEACFPAAYRPRCFVGHRLRSGARRARRARQNARGCAAPDDDGARVVAAPVERSKSGHRPARQPRCGCSAYLIQALPHSWRMAACLIEGWRRPVVPRAAAERLRQIRPSPDAPATGPCWILEPSATPRSSRCPTDRPPSSGAARDFPGGGAMDNFDVLLARPNSVLRLIVRRRATSTVSRGLRVAATGVRSRQETDLERLLLWGTVIVCLELLAQGCLAAVRWAGQSSRHRGPRKPRLAPPTPRDGFRTHGLAAFLAGTARRARGRAGLAWSSWRTVRTARRRGVRIGFRAPAAPWRAPLPRRRGGRGLPAFRAVAPGRAARGLSERWRNALR